MWQYNTFVLLHLKAFSIVLHILKGINTNSKVHTKFIWMVEGTYKYEHKYDIRCQLTFWLINLPLSLAMAPHTLCSRGNRRALKHNCRTVWGQKWQSKLQAACITWIQAELNEVFIHLFVAIVKHLPEFMKFFKFIPSLTFLFFHELMSFVPTFRKNGDKPGSL